MNKRFPSLPSFLHSPKPTENPLPFYPIPITTACKLRVVGTRVSTVGGELGGYVEEGQLGAGARATDKLPGLNTTAGRILKVKSARIQTSI